MVRSGTTLSDTFVLLGSSNSYQEGFGDLLEVKLTIERQPAVDVGFDPLGGIFPVSSDDRIKLEAAQDPFSPPKNFSTVTHGLIETQGGRQGIRLPPIVPPATLSWHVRFVSAARGPRTWEREAG